MIRLNKRDYVILQAALVYATEDDRDPWDHLSDDDQARGEEIKEAISADIDEEGEWDVEDDLDVDPQEEDDDGLDFDEDDE